MGFSNFKIVIGLVLFAFLDPGFCLDSCDHSSSWLRASLPIKSLSEKSCKELKESKPCQDFYRQQILDDGLGVPIELDCETSTTTAESAAWRVGYCFAGVGQSNVELGSSLVSFVQEGRQSLADCDANIELKRAMYLMHNQGVPKLLGVDIPSEAVLKKTTCAQLEAQLLRAIRAQSRRVSEKYDHLLVQTPRGRSSPYGPLSQSSEVEGYLRWKGSRIFAAPDFAISTDFIDEIINQIGVRKQCLHPLAMSALSCDVFYQAVSLGFLKSPKGASKFLRSIQQALNLKKLNLRVKVEEALLKDTNIFKLAPKLKEYADVPVLKGTLGDLPGAGSSTLFTIINGSKGNKWTDAVPALGSLKIDGKLFPVHMKVFKSPDGETGGAIVYILDPKGKVISTAVPDGAEAGRHQLLEMARQMRQSGKLP